MWNKEEKVTMNKRTQPKPLLIAFSAPSGAGKTTICKKLVQRHPDFKISVSATTRPPRPNEQDGVDYFFMSEEEFRKHIENKNFLEYENVHGHYYGTLRSKVEELLSQGYTVLFDIDVNGALNIKKQFPEAILIFIKPPSIEELRRRLRKRHTDDEAEIEKRLQRLQFEYERAKLFDYIVVNDNLERTIRQIEEIIETHRSGKSHVSNRTIS